jgi:hypothetical protein
MARYIDASGEFSEELNDDLKNGLPAGEALDKMQKELEDKGIIETITETQYMCVRRHDGTTKYSKGVKWIEWYEDMSAKGLNDKPQVGFSLFMSPFHPVFFTWQTSKIIEILQESDDYTHFKTQNSEYKLFKGDIESLKSSRNNNNDLENWVGSI